MALEKNYSMRCTGCEAGGLLEGRDELSPNFNCVYPPSCCDLEHVQVYVYSSSSTRLHSERISTEATCEDILGKVRATAWENRNSIYQLLDSI